MLKTIVMEQKRNENVDMTSQHWNERVTSTGIYFRGESHGFLNICPDSVLLTSAYCHTTLIVVVRAFWMCIIFVVATTVSGSWGIRRIGISKNLRFLDVSVFFCAPMIILSVWCAVTFVDGCNS